MLVLLKERTLPDGHPRCPTATCVRPTSTAISAGQEPRPENGGLGRGLARSCCLKARSAFAGGPTEAPTQASWNLEDKDARHDSDVTLRLSLLEGDHAVQRHRAGRFPYFGGVEHEHFSANDQRDVLVRNVPVRRIALGRPAPTRAARGYGVRPPGRASTASSAAYRRAGCAELRRQRCPTRRPGRNRSPAFRATRSIPVARQFADNAEKTHGQLDGDHRRGR